MDVFCKIIAGEIPSEKILDEEDLIAVHDVQPKAPLHALVIPRAHIASLADLQDGELAGKLLIATKRVAEKLGIAKDGYRVMINSGLNGGQEVPHLHIHVLGGKKL